MGRHDNDPTDDPEMAEGDALAQERSRDGDEHLTPVDPAAPETPEADALEQRRTV